MRVYRVNRELLGKDLSANTMASFTLAQRLQFPVELKTDIPMNKPLLVFLNRDSAIKYWTKNEWLSAAGENLILTKAGLEKVMDRLNARAGGQSVEPAAVLYWMNIMSTGNADEDMVHAEFDF